MKNIFVLITVVLASYFNNAVLAQVNLQTGTPQISFPLYSIADNKTNLSTSASLVYTGKNGLNVDEIAGDFGTSWNLDAGGVITRQINGQPDDQKYQGTNFSPDYGYILEGNPYYPDGYMYSTYAPGTVPAYASQIVSLPGGSHVAPSRAPLAISADREQDLYTFSFNGRTGQFYIGKDKSISIVEDSKLQISFQEQNMTSQGIRTTINQFKITDENGFVYIFSNTELSAVTEYLPQETNGPIVVNSPLYTQVFTGHLAANLPYFVSKWYLTSITNPFTSDQITFIYDTYNIDLYTTRHLVKNADSKYFYVYVDRSKGIFKRLSRINMPNYQSIKFIYNSLNRVDLPGANAIDKIQLISTFSGTDKVESYYSFNFGYFNNSQIVPYNYSFSQSELRWSRLCLQSFQKFSADGSLNTNPVAFNYKVSSYGVAPQFSLQRDQWGYYADPGSNLENPDGSINGFTPPSASYSYSAHKYFIDAVSDLSGMISKVIYASGGSISYNYEQNTAGDSPLPNNIAGGVRVSNTITDDGFGNQTQTNYKYVGTDGVTSSGLGFEAPINTVSTTNILSNIPANYSTGSGGFISQLFVSAFMNYCGLSAVRFSPYVTTLDKAIGVASIIVSLIEGNYEEAIIEAIPFFLSTGTTNKTVVSATDSWDNSVLGNLLPLMYSRVEVSQTKGSVVNGKVVYYFTSYADYPPLVPAFNGVNTNYYTFPYSNRQRLVPYEYGLLRKTQYYDNTPTPTNPIKETINTYTAYVNTRSSDDFVSNKWGVNTYKIATASDMPYPATLPASYVTSDIYYPVYGRMELTSTEDKTYDKNGAVFDKITNYNYNADNYQVNNIETFNNANSSEITGSAIYYPSDYNTNVNYSGALLDKNIWNVPVTTAQYRRTGSSFLLTGATASIFTQLANNEIKTSQVYGLETTAPVSNSFISTFSGAIAPNGYSYMALKKSLSYDNVGTLIASTQNGQTESYISGYTGRYNNAKAFNCSYNSIAYTSFEEKNNNNGNWSYDATKIISTSAKTGVNSFKLSTSPLVSITTQQTLTAGTTYVVSLWLKNGSGTCTINGSAITQVLNNTDGWTYCSQKISGVTAITIGGTGTVDDVRLYPNGAMMTSFTYDFMKGVTSQEDAAGRILFNDYDALGRLDIVYDQNRKIVKKYSYNDAGQQTNYAGNVFYNNGQIGYFRGSCAANYINDQVPFPVAANTYKSIISQDDADQQAADYIAANGQAYANAHPACRVPANITVTYNNATSSYGHIQFTNTATHVVYTFDLVSNASSGTVAGTIPQGIYTAYMYSSGTGSYRYRIYDVTTPTPQPTLTIPNPPGLDFSGANVTTFSVGITN